MIQYYHNGKRLSQADINRCFIVFDETWRTMERTARYPSRKEYVQKMVSQWRRRLHMEAQRSTAYFVTLTYSEDNLPATLGCVAIKKELQRFFKRLRSRLVYLQENVYIKYYLVSEFGDTTNRLHYHMLLFTNCVVSLHRLRDILDSCWKVGRTQVKNCSSKFVNYVTKYIHKRYNSEWIITLKSNGIGMSYVTPEFIERQKKRGSRYVWLNGRKVFLPRYVAQKIWNDDERIKINSSDCVKSPLEIGISPKRDNKLAYIATRSTVDFSPDTYIYELVEPYDEILLNRIYKLLNE